MKEGGPRRQLPDEAKSLVEKIRRSKALPTEPGLLKYDFPATWKELLSGQFGIFLLVAIVFVPLWKLTIFRGLPSWFSWIIVGIFAIMALADLNDWGRRKRGDVFILLTPKYLISAYMERPICYEWRYMSELCIEADGALGPNEPIQVRDFPLMWDENKLDERAIVRAKTDAASDKDFFEAMVHGRAKEVATLTAGNRRFAFDYAGEKESVAIPNAVDLRTLAKFVNLYWTKCNPGAKKKGVIYL